MSAPAANGARVSKVLPGRQKAAMGGRALKQHAMRHR